MKNHVSILTIVNGGVSTTSLGMLIQILDYLFPDMEIKWILRRLVQEVSGLDQFRPQGVKGDVGGLESPIKPFR